VTDQDSTAEEIRIVVVMGVSGAGKTTVGQALARSLGWEFFEGDVFHPRVNIEKMRTGHPLTDADRAPWLAALRALIDGVIARREHGVLACSALRHQYRKMLTPEGRARNAVRFVYLEVPEDVLRQRLEQRRGHYMKPSMLASQLAILEPPTRAEAIDGTLPVDTIVRQIRQRLSL
jgi:gluconokinase